MPDSPANSTTDISAPPSTVFAALTAPETYPEWLVGAQHIRAVDPNWPARGSRFQHTIGVGPLRLRDATEVIECSPDHRLELRAGIGALGSASVRFLLIGRGDRTTVEMEEVPEQGVVRVLWRLGAATLIRGLLWGRNNVSLSALRGLVEA